jgi:hypothetical protein
MLAEKFFLLLETLKSRTYSDGSPRVVSSLPHVPVELPNSSLSRSGTEARAIRVPRIAPPPQLQQER